MTLRACLHAGLPAPMWMPALTGAAIGVLFAALNRYCMVRLWRSPEEPLRVVVTGASKGLGKALAREFLMNGDHVVITGRSQAGLDAAIADLRSEINADINVTGAPLMVLLLPCSCIQCFLATWTA